MVGNGASIEGLSSIKNGEHYGYVQMSEKWNTWTGLDAFARHFAGDEVIQLEMPHQILTQETIGDESADDLLQNLPRDMEAQFRELWRVDE